VLWLKQPNISMPNGVLVSLTNYHELSNEPVAPVTASRQSVPMTHALYVRSQVMQKRMCGVIFALTAHCMQPNLAAETRKTTHHSLAPEITSIANGSGVPSVQDMMRRNYRSPSSSPKVKILFSALIPSSNSQTFSKCFNIV
jgi:hypothetical protein